MFTEVVMQVIACLILSTVSRTVKQDLSAFIVCIPQRNYYFIFLATVILAPKALYDSSLQTMRADRCTFTSEPAFNHQ